ncbi:MAG: 23S rRNA (pseudouridine(1915)-N(3))-methyltransferase RlmH [Bacteroidota bacterium]|nr:23S rRNA (pseudouridine(1915)-N(3))-methyltransferase RlmH [Bacteroidota bacterium]
MNISLIRIGKLHLDFAQDGFLEYQKRLKHYCKFNDELLLVNSKSKDPEQIKKAEAEAILKKISSSDYVVLLDEKGKSINSIKWARQIEQFQIQNTNLVFVIGGAYGFDETVYKRANAMLSFSAFTFSHQLMPLLFGEQFYRAFTIIKGEPYHHS